MRYASAVFVTRCPLCDTPGDVIVEPAQLVRLVEPGEGADTAVVVIVDHAPATHPPYAVVASAHLRGPLTAAEVPTAPFTDHDPFDAAALVFVVEDPTTKEQP